MSNYVLIPSSALFYSDHRFYLSNKTDRTPSGPPLKHAYGRPQFLQLNSEDEIMVTADHAIRPIIVPRDQCKLPWNSGYAECINAGKSLRNEDQAAVHRGLLRTVFHPDDVSMKVAEMMPIIPGSFSSRPPMTSSTSCPSLSLSQPGSAHTVNGTQTAIEEPIVNGVEAEEGSIPQTPKPNPLSADGLMSPTEPFPLREVMQSPSPQHHSHPSTSTSSHSLSSSMNPFQRSTHHDSFTGFIEESLPYTYFGIFDGHAGSAVAVAASLTLHKIIHDKLTNVADLLVTFGLKHNEVNGTCSPVTNTIQEEDEGDTTNGVTTVFDSMSVNHSSSSQPSKPKSLVINHDKHLSKETRVSFLMFQPPAPEKHVTIDSLIVGALESAFWEMDHLIGQDKRHYKMPGGCTVLVSLFILGKVYVANAGDSRCIMSRMNKDGSNIITPMSFDFTPESERERVKYLGLLKPELLGSEFTHLEYIRRPGRRDLGKKILYRDAFMTGWAYKTVTTEDLKFPLVFGDGKRSRVLATIGVTRGFGDHELKAQMSNVDIKPFLTPQPEVKVFDIDGCQEDLSDSDVLIMGTDGLWDVTSNEFAVETVISSLKQFPVINTESELETSMNRMTQYRYISAAQDLVMSSRGKQREKGKGWKTTDNRVATIDDISVYVIPLKGYQDEYRRWKEARDIVQRTPQPSLSQAMLK